MSFDMIMRMKLNYSVENAGDHVNAAVRSSFGFNPRYFEIKQQLQGLGVVNFNLRVFI